MFCHAERRDGRSKKKKKEFCACALSVASKGERASMGEGAELRHPNTQHNESLLDIYLFSFFRNKRAELCCIYERCTHIREMLLLLLLLAHTHTTFKLLHKRNARLPIGPFLYSGNRRHHFGFLFRNFISHLRF